MDCGVIPNLPMASRSIFNIMRGAAACRSPVTSWSSGRAASRANTNGGPFEQLRDIRVLQSILILGLADSGPDLHILAGLPKQGDSRDPRGRPAKPIDDIGGRRRALAKRFEVGQQAAGMHRRICSDPVVR